MGEVEGLGVGKRVGLEVGAVVVKVQVCIL